MEIITLNLNLPIKLYFPYDDQYLYLGLGDLIIPVNYLLKSICINFFLKYDLD